MIEMMHNLNMNKPSEGIHLLLATLALPTCSWRIEFFTHLLCLKQFVQRVLVAHTSLKRATPYTANSSVYPNTYLQLLSHT